MKKILFVVTIVLSLVVTLFAVYQINPSDCRNCGRCVSACDEDAIYFDTSVGKYQIDPNLCEDCGDCVDRCRDDAIEQVPVSNDGTDVEIVTLSVNVFPNPTATKAIFKVFTEDRNMEGKLSIYNMKGQKIRSYNVDSKNNVTSWDLTNSKGTRVAPGNYLYKLEAGDKTITRAMTVLD